MGAAGNQFARLAVQHLGDSHRLSSKDRVLQYQSILQNQMDYKQALISFKISCTAKMGEKWRTCCWNLESSTLSALESTLDNPSNESCEYSLESLLLTEPGQEVLLFMASADSISFWTPENEGKLTEFDFAELFADTLLLYCMLDISATSLLLRSGGLLQWKGADRQLEIIHHKICNWFTYRAISSCFQPQRQTTSWQSCQMFSTTMITVTFNGLSDQIPDQLIE